KKLINKAVSTLQEKTYLHLKEKKMKNFNRRNNITSRKKLDNQFLFLNPFLIPVFYNENNGIYMTPTLDLIRWTYSYLKQLVHMVHGGGMECLKNKICYIFRFLRLYYLW